MSRPLRRRDSAFVRESSLGPSMTPMVDVTLVILIFFMASTAFMGPEWLLRTGVPRETTGSTTAEGAAFTLPPARFDLVVAVDASGMARVDGMGLSSGTIGDACERIREYAARLGPERLAIFIEPTGGVPYRDVVRLHEACAEAGVEGVGLR